MSTKHDKLYDIQLKTKEVSDIINNNIKQAIDRGDKIEYLEDVSLDLENQATKFQKSTIDIKSKICRENIRSVLIVSCIILLIISIILLITFV